MNPEPPDDSAETDRLLRRVSAGDLGALNGLLARHHERLRRMVRLRLDRRLQGRLDPSDVLQAAFLEAAERLPDYLTRRDMPFFLRLRFLVGQRLLILHRRRLETHLRDAGREVALPGTLPEASSAELAAQLAGAETGPVEAAARAELEQQIQDFPDLPW